MTAQTSTTAAAPLPGPRPGRGVAGRFLYRSYTGALKEVKVRECPDPAAAVAELQEALETEDVAWFPAT